MFELDYMTTWLKCLLIYSKKENAIPLYFETFSFHRLIYWMSLNSYQCVLFTQLVPLDFPLLYPLEHHHTSLLEQQHHHHQLPPLPEILGRQLQVPLQNPDSQPFSLVQTTSSQAVSTTSLAPSPFNFQTVNTSAPTKTTTASPFAFMANAAGPSTTPAASFSFGSNAAGTAASSAVTGTFQFAGSNTEPAGSQTPAGAAGLFQFGATNATAVTTATPQASSQTFGLSSTPVSSSSQTVKPFAFNAGSTSQGFSFAPAQPSGTAGGLRSTFNFGASAPKPEATFAGFAPAQPSSSQQTISLLPLKNFLMTARLILTLLCFHCRKRWSCVHTMNNVKVIPEFCIAHSYCARFLRHQRAHMSARAYKT